VLPEETRHTLVFDDRGVLVNTSASATSGTQDRAPLLDGATREKLVAVVVDANAYGEVGPDIVRLTSLAAVLDKIGIQTWVPEPVAWEWAEHLTAEWTTSRSFVKKPLSHLARAGLPAMAITPSFKDRTEVINAFLRILAEIPHVKIIALTGESAVQGLKDQILQRPPAKTKSTEAVKTGGSDSAWLRDVLIQAGTPEALLFLSQDGDIKRAFEVWGHGQPLMRTPTTVRATLFDDVPASTDDQWLVARYLSRRVPLDLDDAAGGAAGQLVGNTEGLLDALDLDWEEHGWTGGSLTRLTALAGLTNVMCEPPELHEPGRKPETRTIRSTAFFLADAETTHVFRFGDDKSVSETTSPHTGLLARTRLVFQVRGGEVIDVRPDSDTTVFTASRYHESWDATEEVDDALTSVPGLTLPEGWGGWQSDGDQQIAIAGSDQVVHLFWGYGDHGGFVVKIGDDEARITCEYDDSSWVGGKDGLYVDPPYYVMTETPKLMAEGAWPLSAWIIAQLLAENAKPSTGMTDREQE